ncbi:LysR family transcriptional regulator [Frigidibacter sp. ROC022]|uniref:LysR family transcriptional regulator n=1 Tax=Frigidibacter sp. ROC022 TaxID=2971796 RepID=UPI00215AB5A0|nr:LysR family transcriptional regulator [Frigidibacter sp. ROC022]MCR8723733.1 LysR family transcriptional regulator [Frigidibacter sp. ROC022]
MINLRQFRHFIAVLESTSLLEASRKVNISQPALSKSIGSLESYYGVALFQRLPRGVRPTAFALTLEPHARRLLHDLVESETEMAALASGSTGTVAVGVGAAFVPIASETIRDLDREFPEVRFRVITDHARNLRQALLGNQIEFYVGMANSELDDPMFEVERLFADNLLGICSRHHPFAGQVVRPEQCRDSEWIVPALEEPGRAALDAYFVSTLKRKPRVKVTTNADHLMRQFLSGTRYLSITPELSLRMREFSSFGHFRLAGFDFQREVGIVRRTGDFSTPLGRRFSEMLATRLRALPNPD